MDIFRVLTRGAAIKKGSHTQKNSDPVDFANNVSTKDSVKREENKINRELDFFRNKKHAKIEERSSKSLLENGTSKDDEDEESDIENEIPEPIITNAEEAKILRKSYQGNVTGSDIPLPIGSFEDLISRFKFNKKLLSNLIDNNFTEPTAIQSESIPIIMNDNDLIACSPTGSGKTLAFLIPVLQKIIDNKNSNGLQCLIISPTKELANQIFIECEKLSRSIFLDKKRTLKIALLSKSLSMKLKKKIINDKKYDLIISTPLRLIDLMKNNAIDISNIKHLIFDEADKLFDKTFIEQSDHIINAIKDSNNLKKIMFSATIPSRIEEIAQSIMDNPIRVIIGKKEAANLNINQKLIFCGNEEGKLIAIKQLIQEGQFKPPVIIFLESITRAKALYHEMMYDKINVDVIHSERTQIQRDKIIDNFKNGQLWCLICTDVLSRGIDFKGINLVINYDVPNSSQSYIHRIGRTGRGGRDGNAVTLYTKQDALLIKPIINVMKQSGFEMPNWMDTKLSKRDKENIKRGKAHKDRKQISTVPRANKQKRKFRKEMIEASKRRKYESMNDNGNGSEGENKNDDN